MGSQLCVGIRYVSAYRRGIDGPEVAFADLPSSVPKLGLDEVGDRGRHAVTHYIPALQVAAKALLFLDRQTEPQFVGRLT